MTSYGCQCLGLSGLGTVRAWRLAVSIYQELRSPASCSVLVHRDFQWFSLFRIQYQVPHNSFCLHFRTVVETGIVVFLPLIVKLLTLSMTRNPKDLPQGRHVDGAEILYGHRQHLYFVNLHLCFQFTCGAPNVLIPTSHEVTGDSSSATESLFSGSTLYFGRLNCHS